jgi:hypothetical protein
MVDYTDFVRKSTGFASLDRSRARTPSMSAKFYAPPIGLAYGIQRGNQEEAVKQPVVGS